jgi:hypothetical protein
MPSLAPFLWDKGVNQQDPHLIKICNKISTFWGKRGIGSTCVRKHHPPLGGKRGIGSTYVRQHHPPLGGKRKIGVNICNKMSAPFGGRRKSGSTNNTPSSTSTYVWCILSFDPLALGINFKCVQFTCFNRCPYEKGLN